MLMYSSPFSKMLSSLGLRVGGVRSWGGQRFEKRWRSSHWACGVRRCVWAMTMGGGDTVLSGPAGCVGCGGVGGQ